MDTVRTSTAALIAALTGAVGFALGRATPPAPTPPAVHAEPAAAAPEEQMPMPGMAPGTALPAGHPAVGDMQQGNADLPPAGEASITWVAPPRWKSVPNPSAMRLATFKIPHQPGDTEDAELSITQVGGDVDANIDRWIGQFDQSGQAPAKRSTKKVKGLKVTFVEIEGAFSGGMGQAARVQQGWALLGAIIETSPMPHFFKMTGPAKSVKAARVELEGMVDSITPK